MYLERESSAHESVEDNELATNPDSVSNLDFNKDKVQANGSYLNVIHSVDTSRNVDTNASYKNASRNSECYIGYPPTC